MPLEPAENFDFLPDVWEREFAAGIDVMEFIPLMEAANKVNCPALLEMMAACVASRFKNLSHEKCEILWNLKKKEGEEWVL